MEYWFRAKRLDDDQWEYGGVDGSNTHIISHYQFIPIRSDTVGIHMGLSDVNGYGVYHGDILQVLDAPEDLFLEVAFTPFGWTYEIHESSVGRQFPANFSVKRCKVVGNVWDGITGGYTD